MFNAANSIEAVIETTTVDGTSVNYEVRPRMTKEQTERAVGSLTSAIEVVCAGGILARRNASVACTAAFGGKKTTYVVRTLSVDDDNGMTLSAVSKDGDGVGEDYGLDYCRGCPE